MKRSGPVSFGLSRGLATIGCAAVAILLCAMPQTTFGQARIWNGGGADSNWSTAANWNVNTTPPLTALTEGWRFGSSAVKLVTEMDNAYSFGQLQFNGQFGYVINSASNHTLSLAGFNTGQFITLTAGNNATINVPVALVAGSLNTGFPTEVNRRTIDTNTGSLTINGAINAGGYNVRKLGAGTLTLGTSNTMSGTFEINNGEVRLGSNTALGTATIMNTTGNNIRIVSNSATPLVLANNFDLSVGAGATTFTEVGGPDATLTGTITTATVRAFGVADGTTLNVNGQITGAGGVSKNVGGTMILNADNDYTGLTTIANGTLVINGASTSDTLVGAGKLQGHGMARILSVYDTGVFSPGDDTAAATFTASRADFADGGSYLFNLNDAAGAAGTGWDLLNLTGVDTANGNIDVTAGAGLFTVQVAGLGANFDASVTQAFTLVQALGVTTFDSASFVVDTTGFTPDLLGGSFSVVQNGNNLDLQFTAVPEPMTMTLLGLGMVTMIARRRRA